MSDGLYQLREADRQKKLEIVNLGEPPDSFKIHAGLFKLD